LAQQARKSQSAPVTAEGSGNVAEFSVSELSQAIKRALEEGFSFVRLRGEISGYRGPHASGHCYFSLKDDKSKIEAVIWRTSFQRLRFKPQEGLEVVASGRVTTYPGSSKYQIVVEMLEPAGVGALMALLEERRRKLASEGLFDDGRKRALPFLPRVIGIVTSPTGAVIRDMLHGFDERFPAHVIVWPVRVQGDTCAAEVAAAIRGFNAIAPGSAVPRPDVLIVARGGGSLEDLWGFNEEIVVRAAAESTIPLISAVGHETDWTLIDLVADARAPTPTKAAEWAVPQLSDLVEQLDDQGLRLRRAIRRLNEARRVELRAAARGLPRVSDLIALPRQRFDTLDRRLSRGLQRNTTQHAMRLARVATRLRPGLVASRLERARERLERLSRDNSQCLSRYLADRRGRLERITARLRPERLDQRIDHARERLDRIAGRALRALGTRTRHERRRLASASQLLASLSYRSVLGRGFALVRDEAGNTVRSVGMIAAGQRLDLELADGHIGVDARTGGPDETPEAEPAKSIVPVQQQRPQRTGGRGGGNQGELF
jgi:exodeoxyribonuclease VII large subunit